MTKRTVIIGNGTIGSLVADILLARGGDVRIAQRRRPATLKPGLEHIPCDVLDAAAVRNAVDGATHVLLAVAFPYDARVWKTAWPTTIRNVVEACAAVGAKVVFIDNLYQLGPQTEPRREDMALSTAGEKAAILTGATAIWMAARDRVRFAALRCPDFYGPGVVASHLGPSTFGALAQGRSASMIVPPDIPHAFAYAPDIARAAVTLLDADDDAYGQVWNMPCAEIQTPRQLLQLGAVALNVPLKLTVLPLWTLPVVGLFSRFIKEVWDVRYTWDRPYTVDASKFMTRFGFVPTPFETGIPATARSLAAAG
ncbi:Nucleoside-diphosphate-sugar epimerase [Devosia sp. YR412]|uniref:NAD-dependent epimerase/dehydratase family protein n=1 Tax=Devosia sp. YR412 TaxID=1881030 RepID=UPI0008BFD48A|nr:NAD-dependent epimerase/dehydratase family protein [Devosia sp. YR412]SEP68528.1 Nucleoside-diphosphate-sugar epimerase [Devosia sp. YR412]